MSEPEDLIRTITEEGVRDPRLLEALRAVPRAGFVPTNLAEQAYEDKPLPIPHDQVTTQPSLVARMVAALALAGTELVLEVGAAFPSVPRPLEEQLAAGGRLVQPVGPGGKEEVVLFEKGTRGFVRRRTKARARFVRLHGEHAFSQ